MRILGKGSAGPRAAKKKVLFVYLQDSSFHPNMRDHDLDIPAALPLGLACVKAYAAADREITRKASLSSLAFSSGTPEKAVLAALAARKPDVIAFSSFFLNEAATLRACGLLKKKFPKLAIIVGGASVPRQPGALAAFMKKNPAIDAAVFGEGELPFAAWLKARLAGAAPARLDGLAVRGPGGLALGGAPAVPDFAALPSAYLSGAAPLKRKSGGLLAIETARGCPFVCAYCATDAAQRALRYFPLERLEQELAWLKARKYDGLVWLVDPIINLDKKRAAGVFRLLAAAGGQYMLNLKPELLDDDLIALLGKVRGVRAAIGVQTVNPGTLRNISRRADPARSAAGIRKLLRHKSVTPVLQVILGLPGDNYGKFKKTLDWVLGFGEGALINVYDLLILPNSGLSGLVGRFGIKTAPDGMVTENYSFSKDDFMRASWCVAVHHAIRATPGMPELFRRACRGGIRPSAVLERLALKAVKLGLLPRRRLVVDSLGGGAMDRAFLETELGGGE